MSEFIRYKDGTTYRVPEFHIASDGFSGQTMLTFEDDIVNGNGLLQYFTRNKIFDSMIGQPLTQESIYRLKSIASNMLHELAQEGLIVKVAPNVWEFRIMEPVDILKEMVR